MKAIRKRPGEAPVLIQIPNTLEALRSEVGGYIETYTFVEDACVVCNEEGGLLGLPHCSAVCGVDFVGTILIVGVNGEELCDIANPNMAAQLLLHEVLEAKDENP